ncbi:hypothetical protein [Paenibacillus sp. IHBB 3054]|uniref:hypothetical protein n=1 Tax=Paenibacillus sp. IHBB 3054 TaxID=3425689 RepID=UPI003F662767
MQTQTKWGAMYGQLEEGDKIQPIMIQLGDRLIIPGDKITRIGRKKRSMFEMQDGFYLVYQGVCEEHLMYSPITARCAGKSWENWPTHK